MLKPGIRCEDHAPLEFTSVVGKAAMLEGLAEEASQVAFAALLYARYIRGNNPPEYPDMKEETYLNLIEDRVSDLFVYLDDLQIFLKIDRYFQQVEEFRKRLKEPKNDISDKIQVAKDKLKEIEQNLNSLKTKLQALEN